MNLYKEVDGYLQPIKVKGIVKQARGFYSHVHKPKDIRIALWLAEQPHDDERYVECRIRTVDIPLWFVIENKGSKKIGTLRTCSKIAWDYPYGYEWPPSLARMQNMIAAVLPFTYYDVHHPWYYDGMLQVTLRRMKIRRLIITFLKNIMRTLWNYS